MIKTHLATGARLHVTWRVHVASGMAELEANCYIARACLCVQLCTQVYTTRTPYVFALQTQHVLVFYLGRCQVLTLMKS